MYLCLYLYMYLLFMSVFVYVFVFNLYLSCEGMLVRKWPLNDLTGSEPSQGRQFCARRTFLPLLIITIFLVCEFVSHIFWESLCVFVTELTSISSAKLLQDCFPCITKWRHATSRYPDNRHYNFFLIIIILGNIIKLACMTKYPQKSPDNYHDLLQNHIYSL